MKKGGGKGKGGEFERQVCKLLSLWVTEGGSNSVFWRSASSGGKATQDLKRGILTEWQSGDMCAVQREGLPFIKFFYVEMKSYRSIGLDGLVWGGGKTDGVVKWWRSTIERADQYNKQPMLIMKQNRKTILLGLRLSTLKILSTIPDEKPEYLLISPKCDDLVLLEFDKFFKDFFVPEHLSLLLK